jgi:hypothetical protein
MLEQLSKSCVIRPANSGIRGLYQDRAFQSPAEYKSELGGDDLWVNPADGKLYVRRHCTNQDDWGPYDK